MEELSELEEDEHSEGVRRAELLRFSESEYLEDIGKIWSKVIGLDQEKIENFVEGWGKKLNR